MNTVTRKPLERSKLIYFSVNLFKTSHYVNLRTINVIKKAKKVGKREAKLVCHESHNSLALQHVALFIHALCKCSILSCFGNHVASIAWQIVLQGSFTTCYIQFGGAKAKKQKKVTKREKKNYLFMSKWMKRSFLPLIDYLHVRFIVPIYYGFIHANLSARNTLEENFRSQEIVNKMNCTQLGNIFSVFLFFSIIFYLFFKLQ